ncbi:aspartate aminotransferase family protein [Yinghuangia seranimata]|uniref:aspartate aminotransferase family protein n=1 Tax=Yinghuangia seranimata TaxID=408067 RepID=UPI00248B8C3E|nr:aminotransferase class III-fold pyridoxal phosphate-dependent enzyme [Yinghuangia seranimata]MDI2125073.1 aminotransferase class III-fold pyridoxal phosphate-dependent enzyme [Yinghuangia seranimata]
MSATPSLVPPVSPVSSLAGVWSRITRLDVVSGSGAWVETSDGQRYLDFTAGIAVCSTGHSHPHVVEAVRRQAGRIMHAQVNCYQHDLLEPLADRLVELTPGSIERFFFSNSGAEAVEAAVKLAKQATGRTGVVVFQGSFHGRTHLTAAMTTSKAVYRLHAQPLPSGVFVAPFPAPVGDRDADAEVERCLAGVRELLDSTCHPSDVAAFVIEPVQGEGGYRPVPAAFLRGLREICDEHGILLVVDEVQTGFGRTGAMFAIEHYGVEPDVMVLAKGIASGMPLSAVGARASVMESWVPGSHGGTYGGNAVACAAALATIDVLTGPGALEHVRALAEALREALLEVGSAHPDAVVDVRGLGLMLAIEFADPAVTQRIVGGCLERNLILTTAGARGAAVRWMPPLVVSRAELDQAVAVFREVVASVLAG